jgi:hypothetical protein
MHAYGQINFTQLKLSRKCCIRVQVMSFDEIKTMQKRNTPNACLEN